MGVIEQIKEIVETNPIVLFMKGDPQFPQCGFSSRAVQALQASGIEFAHVDILSNPDIRSHLPQYSNWPTFPQLFVNGELIGGCDIIIELFEKGELKKIAETTTAKNT
ncbi:Grx4 family monothiol glutaredoxin [Candidatus Nitrosacidococcus sp. I8]|uniref:Grx4 family monothiol glutaredoxin n=1 Tax=Candidatus Nitrosacidococcus sp. I8 TaxID=2942908 RepID=UPI0024CACB66|nr:Glutaredoxin 4 [Candidatus Nitrosacidococcus sp. I8]